MGGACSNGKEPRHDSNQQNNQNRPAQNGRQQQQQQQNNHHQQHQNQQIHPMRQQSMAPSQQQRLQQNGYNQQQQQMMQRQHTGYMPPSYQQRNGQMPVAKVQVLYNQIMVRQKTLKLAHNTDDDSYQLEFTYDSLVPSQFTIYYFINEKVQFFHQLVLEIHPHPQFNSNNVPEIFQIKEDEVGNNKQYQTKTKLQLPRMDPTSLKHSTVHDQTFWPLVIKLEQQNPRQVIYLCCEFEKHGDKYEIRMVKQKLELAFQSYQIQEIYGINNTQFISGDNVDQNELANEDNTNRECIICFTDLIDTVIMPCRHMCICMECAKSIQQQKQKNKKMCPICRKQIESFLRIKKDQTQQQQQQQPQQQQQKQNIGSQQNLVEQQQQQQQQPPQQNNDNNNNDSLLDDF